MKIVIEVTGDQVTSVNYGDSAAAPLANVGDTVPGPLPPELLERARKLGAMNAGAAQFGRGAALASSAYNESVTSSPAKAKKTVKKRSRRAG